MLLGARSWVFLVALWVRLDALGRARGMLLGSSWVFAAAPGIPGVLLGALDSLHGQACRIANCKKRRPFGVPEPVLEGSSATPRRTECPLRVQACSPDVQRVCCTQTGQLL